MSDDPPDAVHFYASLPTSEVLQIQKTIRDRLAAGLGDEEHAAYLLRAIDHVLADRAAAPPKSPETY